MRKAAERLRARPEAAHFVFRKDVNTMTRTRALPLLAALALAWAPLPGRAQVTATLVSAVASVEPGTPFTVAVRLEHKEHWHSYWVNQIGRAHV